MADTSARGAKSVEFSVADVSDGGSGAPRPSMTKKNSKRRSSLLKQLSQSFRRSGGERGADVETLRGTHGPEFEAEAIINRAGDTGIGCGCFGGKDMKKQRLVLIKGPFIFVFTNESDKAPKYAISLAHLKAKSQGTSGGMYVVMLETSLGDAEYEVSFKTEGIAKEFLDVVKRQAAVGEAEEVRKRLGHENLLTKRSSVRYAEKVALKKVEDQPAKQERLTAEEMARVTGNPALDPALAL